MENRQAPKSCTFYLIRMRRDAVMQLFHDTKIDKRLETFTQQHSFALYRTPAKLGKKT